MPALTTLEEALEERAERIHADRPRNILTSGRVVARRCRRRPRRGGRRRRRRFRDGLRRARLYRARGWLRAPRRRPHRDPGLHAGALYGSRRRCEDPRHRARAGADHPDRGRRRLRLEARSVGPALHRGRRLAARSAGPHGLFAPRIDHDDDQAPSRAHCRQGRRDARRASHRDGLRRRFQHRRLRLLGTDGRQPRAGARLRPVSHAALSGAGARDPHASRARRRLSRLRRAAERDRAGAALRRARDSPAASIRSSSASSTRSASASRP